MNVRPLLVLAVTTSLVLVATLLPAAAQDNSEAEPRPAGPLAELLQRLRERNRPAPTGHFASRCIHSHFGEDDPIVFPDQPGASHLHEFFGSRDTDAFSTPDSMRAEDTTCVVTGDTAAYWVPALYDDGRLITPAGLSAYHVPAGKDPSTIQPFPADLQVIAGPATDEGNPVRWVCRDAGTRTPPSTEVPDCEGGTMVQIIHFPDCWDGVNLDSEDHRGHMAYSTAGACPDSHPVPTPRLRLHVRFPGADGGEDLTLSSGGPETAHADFVNAWDQQVLEELVEECIVDQGVCGHLPPS